MKSLQELCLKEIIFNFDLFNLVYSNSTTEDKTLKLQFQFLQRAYSFHIVTLLLEHSSIKEEYADFVINKFLKTIHTAWLNNISWDTIARKFSEIGPSLEKIAFGDDDDLPWKDIICHLINLKSLFYQDDCDDTILLAVSEFCPKIEVIDVKNSFEVSDDGIKHLCRIQNGEVVCPALKELEINCTSIGNDGVKYLLKHSPSIQKIGYEKLPEVLYSIHNNDFNDFANVGLYNITHLNLTGFSDPTTCNNILEVCISVCRHLESIAYHVFSKENLDICSRLSELKELQLDCLKEPTFSINDILKLRGKKLLSLKLRNFSFSVSTLAKSCPQLNSLVMEKVTFECNDNESVPVLHNLEKLCFDRLTLTDLVTTQSVIALLSSSLNLKYLDFKYCETIPLNIKTQLLKCCEHCKLEHIDFAYSGVEFEFVWNVLLTCSLLKILNLEGCKMCESSADMEQLETVSNTLPNRPFILYNENFSNDFSDSDDYYNDFDDDDFDGDYYDYDYDDDDEEENEYYGLWY